MRLFLFLYSLPAYPFNPTTCTKDSKCPIGATECTCDETGRLYRIYWEIKTQNKLMLSQRWDVRDKNSKKFKTTLIVHIRDSNGRLLELHHETSDNSCTRHDRIQYLGNYTTIRTFDLNGNGTIDRRVRTQKNASGSIVEVKIDKNGDGIFNEQCTFSPPCPDELAVCKRSGCKMLSKKP